MPPEPEENEIRAYLLGLLPAQERLAIERYFLEGSTAVERLRALETELIDDYLRDELTPLETEQFSSHFLVSPERRQKVEYARAFLRTFPGRGPSRSLLHGRTKAVKATVALLAAGIVLVFAFGVFENLRLRKEVKRLAISERPAGRTSSTVSFLLPSGSLRSVEVRKNLVVPSDITLVQFRLELGIEPEGPLRARLRTAEDEEVWRQRIESGGRATEDGLVTVESPAGILAERDYILVLEVASAKGDFKPIESYAFRISRPMQ